MTQVKTIEKLVGQTEQLALKEQDNEVVLYNPSYNLFLTRFNKREDLHTQFEQYAAAYPLGSILHQLEDETYSAQKAAVIAPTIASDIEKIYRNLKEPTE